ncbi:BrxE family protein [Roseovarius sp. EGI FJ00037]|uniref:BrxE family protein n=1 Tax=Roseovarius salincola TaxID=2978479 RepID=UPI0022A815EC|nr:BrxE family protein [Roseovarius sp. EGI FJ00037]MCZ0814242.1 BrxE family protein [Roseovarius sp. EGI FJ00037]
MIHDSDAELRDIIRLRMAVGRLGEKDHGDWWPSLWFTSNAVAFLTPVYGARTDAARYQGVIEAARVVHDNRIGVGQAFHLFRLPEALERRLHDAVVRDEAWSKTGNIPSESDAEELLSELAEPVEANEGPVRVGSAADLESSSWVKVLAGHYITAFRSSQQVFPYFTVNA